MNTLVFRITNLTCDACIKVCTMLISRIHGVRSVSIDLATGKASVVSDEPVEIDEIQHRLERNNYQLTTE